MCYTTHLILLYLVVVVVVVVVVVAVVLLLLLLLQIMAVLIMQFSVPSFHFLPLRQWFSNFFGSWHTVKHIQIFWWTSCTKLKIYINIF
jgi:hypothetical protein